MKPSACTEHRHGLIAVAMAFAAVVAGCGGGGSGDPVPGEPPPAPPPAPPTISGKASFDSVPYASSAQGVASLNYAAIAAAPIRGATIQLLDESGSVLASTTSDAQGAYTLSVASALSSLRVRVLAEIKGADFDFTVRDNTGSGVVWSMESAPFPLEATVTQDVHAPSGWGGSAYTAARVAGPFAILDIAYLAKEKVLGVAPGNALAPLKIYWSPNNGPTGGTLSSGGIGTHSYFTVMSDMTSESCACSAAAGDRALFVLGAEDIDTDEYDSAVIAHELGHYLQNVASRDDGVRGQHAADDLLDMRTAFALGWRNAWAGMLRDDPVVFNTSGPQQAQGFTGSVATPPTNQGWYSESTVAHLLWNHHQDPAISFAGVYAALTSLRDAPYFSSIFAFNAALRAARPTALTAIDTRSADVGVQGSDAYGTGESNNGGIATSLPVYDTHDVELGQSKTYCVSADAGRTNKLDNHRFIRFTASGIRTITVNRSASTFVTTDPEVDIVTSLGQVLAPYRSPTPNNETIAGLSLPDGTHALALHDYQLFDSGSTGQRCFDLTIN